MLPRLVLRMIIIIIIIINLIYIAHFDTNGILTAAVHSHNEHTNATCARMYLRETII